VLEVSIICYRRVTEMLLYSRATNSDFPASRLFRASFIITQARGNKRQTLEGNQRYVALPDTYIRALFNE
jgi:hypothetical protein